MRDLVFEVWIRGRAGGRNGSRLVGQSTTPRLRVDVSGRLGRANAVVFELFGSGSGGSGGGSEGGSDSTKNLLDLALIQGVKEPNNADDLTVTGHVLFVPFELDKGKDGTDDNRVAVDDLDRVPDVRDGGQEVRDARTDECPSFTDANDQSGDRNDEQAANAVGDGLDDVDKGLDLAQHPEPDTCADGKQEIEDRQVVFNRVVDRRLDKLGVQGKVGSRELGAAAAERGLENVADNNRGKVKHRVDQVRGGQEDLAVDKTNGGSAGSDLATKEVASHPGLYCQ